MAGEPAYRRTVLAAGGALALAGLLAGCGRQAAEAGSLRVAIIGKGEQDQRILFRVAGIDPGVHAEYNYFQSGHLVIEALDGGALDYGGMSEIPPVFAAASPIHSFRQIAVLHGDVNNQVVLVPRNSPIADLAGLKGRKVGYVRATTSHYFLIRMLQSVGLGWRDIVPVALGVPEGAEAFSNGAIDAWAIYGFPIQHAIATQGARVLKTALGFLSGNYIISAHVNALADPAKVELVGRYLRAVRKGYAWTAAHKDEWAAIVARQIGVPLSYVQDQFRNASDPYTLRPVNDAAIASQQAVADLFASEKLIPQAVDVRPLWDNRFNSLIEEKA